MSKKIFWITVVMFATAAAAAGGYALYQSNYEKKYGRINWAKAAISAEMLDGESAQFRNVREVSSVEVCGEVNGKNLYGAYTGFTEFYVLGTPDIQRPGSKPTLAIYSESNRMMYKAIENGHCGNSPVPSH